MTNLDQDTTEDNKVEQILKGAGRRTPIPDDVRGRLESSFRAELGKSQRQQRNTRFTAIGALAASVFVGFFLLLNSPTSVDRETVANVLFDKGEVNWSFDSDTGPLRKGNVIAKGDVIRTTEGSASISPEGSMINIRLAAGTEIVFESNETVRLNHGSIYVDADPEAPHFPMVILANGLSVEHIGTQYLVSRQGMTIEIAVREGEVEIENGLDTIRSQSENGLGEVVMFQDGDLKEQSVVSTFDSRWAWASELAPALETDNLEISEFLEWVSRQSGYEIVYENVEIEEDHYIRGSIDTTNVFESLEVAITSSPFTAIVDEARGQIIVATRTSK